MKLANATPVYKKGSQLRKGNHCLLAFYLMHLKFLNDRYMSKFLNVLKTFCQCGFKKGQSTQHRLVLL